MLASVLWCLLCLGSDGYRCWFWWLPPPPPPLLLLPLHAGCAAAVAVTNLCPHIPNSYAPSFPLLSGTAKFMEAMQEAHILWLSVADVMKNQHCAALFIHCRHRQVHGSDEGEARRQPDWPGAIVFALGLRLLTFHPSLQLVAAEGVG